ncbi:hypothetical protein XHC_0498 [Xanthomonas hortorum pv. carotae str. M081]|nr:hypothetical protein XHC_0498 [Xanthomonas hortorum pv. carotae str. M081]
MSALRTSAMSPRRCACPDKAATTGRHRHGAAGMLCTGVRPAQLRPC